MPNLPSVSDIKNRVTEILEDATGSGHCIRRIPLRNAVVNSFLAGVTDVDERVEIQGKIDRNLLPIFNSGPPLTFDGSTVCIAHTARSGVKVDERVSSVSKSFQELITVLGGLPENKLKDRIFKFLEDEIDGQQRLITVLKALPKQSLGVKILDSHETYLVRLKVACENNTLSEEIKGVGEGTETVLLAAMTGLS